MKLLTVDIGTVNVGWAIASPEALQQPTLILHGVYRPPANVGRNIGWLLVDIRSWLTVTARTHAITNIVYCSPIQVFGNNWWTTRKVVSIAGQIEVTGHDLDILVEEADEPTVRRHFLAPHKVPRKSPEIKAAVMARCAALGINPDTDDAGDAVAVADYVLSVKNSPLLRKIAELI